MNSNSDNKTFVEGVVIDICTRSFLLLGTGNEERVVECESIQEFLNVLKFCTSNLEGEQIQYADLAIKGVKY